MSYLVVVRRELRRLVAVPQTFAIAAAFFVISGIFFVNTVISVHAPDLGSYYSNIAATILVLAPVIAMRSFAEERASGALQLSLSWPLSRTGVVLAKFTVNTLFAWMLVSVAWVYIRLLSQLSTVDVARAGGGYVGLLLLCAAFSALALLVSAWAQTTTSAAFLGFGLLLFLWSLQYAPGWIYWLNRFGPNEHLAPMSQGVLYIADIGYFVVVTAVALTFTTLALNRARPGVQRDGIAVRATTSAVAGVALLVMPPVLSHVKGEVDLTSSRRNTISDTTRQVLAAVKQPIRLTGFVGGLGPQAAELTNVVKEYRAAGAHITGRTIDPDIQPGVAEQLGVTDRNVYLLEVGHRRTVLPDVLEIDLTTAISRLSRPRLPQVCFTVGHGERTPTDTGPGGLSGLAGQLNVLGFRSRPLALGALGGDRLLKDCDAVAVMGPQAGFLPGELGLLDGYLLGGGRLVIAADGPTPALVQLNSLTQRWGLRFDNRGTVDDASSLADDVASVVSSDYPSHHPVVGALESNTTPVVMPFTMAIDETASASNQTADSGARAAPGAYLSRLVASSPKSRLRRADGATVDKGPFTLAAAADATRLSGSGSHATQSGARIVELGTVTIATNRYADVMGDAQLASAALQWASLQNDLVAAHRDPGSVYKLLLTSAQRTRLIERGVVFPALAMLVLLPIAVFRLRRG